jgi:hypothetical protein
MSTQFKVNPQPTFVDWSTGDLSGEGIEESVKTLGQLAGLFKDEAAWRSMDPVTDFSGARRFCSRAGWGTSTS